MNPDHIIWPKPGTYILAVSGGVDSMVLLDVFSKFSRDKDYHLIVAHFDHKMRDDSDQDATFVGAAARSLVLKYELGEPGVKLSSESGARAARYAFLNQIASSIKVDGVITAHHQDDLIETSLLNLARGSRRVGLVPFTNKSILRPFKALNREQILDYAKQQDIKWQEDVTNTDTSNPRNFVRHELLSDAGDSWREKYLAAIEDMKLVNESIDAQIETILAKAIISSGYSIPRVDIRKLSLDGCAEVLLAMTRKLAPGTELSERLVQELIIFAKIAKPGQKRPICKDLELRITKSSTEVVNI